MDNVKTLANAPTLAQRAHNIRRNALRMGEVQGQGYIAQALDIADVLAVAYFHAMRYPPGRSGLGRARPVPALERPLCHRALCGADRGRHRSAKRSLRPTASTKAGCRCRAWPPTRRAWRCPGGSLGLGLSIAVGMGLGLKRKGSDSSRLHPVLRWRARRGLDWEAMMSAAHHKLDNLIAIIDVNNQQADGASRSR